MNSTQIKELLQNLDESKLIELNNIYCQYNRIDNNIIHLNNSEFFESLNWSNYRLAQAISYGSYNFNHKYVKINSNYNLISYSEFNTNNLPDSINKISVYISENFNLFYFLF
jgi:hypothetical protein